MPKSYGDGMKVVVGFMPIDMSAGNNPGDWINLEHYDSCTVIYMSDVGTAGQDPAVTLQQATDNSGSGSKDLEPGRNWYGEQDATVGNVTGDTIASLGADEFTDDGETACIARIEFFASDLDVSGGFKYVRVRATDSGNSAGKLGAAVYVLQGARYTVDVPDQPEVTT